MLRKTVLLFLTIALLAPSIQAHGSPTPIEAEDLILEDERTDSGPGFFWDGYDINYVHVREAYIGNDYGVVFRWFLWGGNLDESNAELSVELEIDGVSPNLVWVTKDNGDTWTMAAPGDVGGTDPPTVCGGDQVLELEKSPDQLREEGGPQSYDVQFQAFVPLCRLGMELGDSLDNMMATSYAADGVVDRAPGGFFNPNTPDQELTDPFNNQARGRLIDSLLLDGPDRYTKSDVSYVDGEISILVDNLIEVTGQHIFATTNLQGDASAHAHDAEGNDVVSGISANPGQDVEFHIPITDFGSVLVYVDTDLGGREVFTVHEDGSVTQGTDEYTGSAGDDAVDTPGVPVAVLVVALVGVVAARRIRSE